MSIIALVDKTTGFVINAVSSPSGNVPVITDPVNQELIEIAEDGFRGLMDGQLKYYNYSTGQMESEIIRRWALLTLGPYSVGIVSLQLQQQDLAGQAVIIPVAAIIYINDQAQTMVVDDGTLEIELDCLDPATVSIKIEAPRHEALILEVVVDG